MVIRREGTYKTGFKYFKGNKEIKDKSSLDQFKSYKIPPAYQNVVIVNTKKIVAYGYDAKGRKQVMYQPSFVKKQNDKKYKKIFASLKTFEKVKKTVARDLKSRNDKKKEIAIIITLIFTCGFRIGNKKYEKDNNTVGLTTLKFSHLKFEKNKIHIDFIGKKGVRNIAICSHKYIYNHLQKKSVEAQSDGYVFCYDDGSKCITSKDVNDYLKKIDQNTKITSKDLRTWNANHLFMKYFEEIRKSSVKPAKHAKPAKPAKPIKNPVKKAIEMVASRLHNTYAICKKSYIDPKAVKYAESLVAKGEKK